MLLQVASFEAVVQPNPCLANPPYHTCRTPKRALRINAIIALCLPPYLGSENERLACDLHVPSLCIWRSPPSRVVLAFVGLWAVACQHRYVLAEDVYYRAPVVSSGVHGQIAPMVLCRYNVISWLHMCSMGIVNLEAA